MLRLVAASSAHALVAEELVERGCRDEQVDHHHEGRWEEVAQAVAENFETPVKTADDEEHERDFVH
jgi:hypothetical protein